MRIRRLSPGGALADSFPIWTQPSGAGGAGLTVWIGVITIYSIFSRDGLELVKNLPKYPSLLLVEHLFVPVVIGGRWCKNTLSVEREAIDLRTCFEIEIAFQGGFELFALPNGARLGARRRTFPTIPSRAR